MKVITSLAILLCSVAVESARPTCPCGNYKNVTLPGRHRADQRIVGGYDATSGNWPPICALELMSRKLFFCACTLVNKKAAVSAAHCFHNLDFNDMRLVCGKSDLTDFHSSEENNNTTTGSKASIYYIENVFIHENYSPSKYVNDIAVIQIKETVEFTESVGPVCCVKDQSIGAVRLTALGWGLNETGGVAQTKLQGVELDVMSSVKCQVKWTVLGLGIIPNPTSTRCTWSRNKDTCQGDSGGPLFVSHPDTGLLTLICLVSYGRRCADPILPAVNTFVTFYVAWIESKLKVINSDLHLCYIE